MGYKYFICDVFTTEQFAGNQLAVFPEAEGLSETEMQQIAREFNFSETTFVFPPQRGQTKKVRIYTPTTEVPFAGHPNIGTAFALAQAGVFGDLNQPIQIVFEEEAGNVPIKICRTDSEQIWCEFSAPEALSIGKKAPVNLTASALSVNDETIVTATHSPQIASVGLPFLIVELSSVKILSQAKVNLTAFQRLIDNGFVSYIHIYCKNSSDLDLRARMFAPLDGVTEDPATGSANAALIGLLTHYRSDTNTEINWQISQGTEIGRPSILNGYTVKKNGKVTEVRIGGKSVLVSSGTLEI